jgi:hypothetical protein
VKAARDFRIAAEKAIVFRMAAQAPKTRFSILSQTESIIFEVVRGELEGADTTSVIIRARDDRPKHFPA